MNFGLALGGGGARGYAHIGVMRVLEREGLRPSFFAGTSMGSLMGVLFAAGFSADETQNIVLEASFFKLLDLNPMSDMLKFSELKKMLITHLPNQFSELQFPLAVAVTDLVAGKQLSLHQGDLFEALRASIAYPGAIDPTWSNDMLLSDGGILNQVPVDLVRFLGARKVVAVDVTPFEQLAPHKNEGALGFIDRILGREAKLPGPQVVFRAIEIMQAQITEMRLAIFKPDVLIRPKLGEVGLFSFHKAKDAIRAGEIAAEAKLAELYEQLNGTL